MSLWNPTKADYDRVSALHDEAIRQRDAANARADAAELEAKLSVDQTRRALDQRDALEASAAAMRSALEWFDRELPLERWQTGEATNKIDAALRTEAGAALLAERERCRELMAEAAVVLRSSAWASGFPASQQALAKRLEEASR